MNEEFGIDCAASQLLQRELQLQLPRSGLPLGVLAPWRDHPDYLSKKSLTQSR